MWPATYGSGYCIVTFRVFSCDIVVYAMDCDKLSTSRFDAPLRGRWTTFWWTRSGLCTWRFYHSSGSKRRTGRRRRGGSITVTRHDQSNVNYPDGQHRPTTTSKIKEKNWSTEQSADKWVSCSFYIFMFTEIRWNKYFNPVTESQNLIFLPFSRPAWIYRNVPRCSVTSAPPP